MSNETISANLRRLRHSKGWTQADLAHRAGLSLAGYRNLETGQSAPRVATLAALAGVLEVKVQELVTPAPQLSRVRFRSFTRLRTREGILAKVARWLNDYNDLEGILGDRISYELANLEPKEPPQAAVEVRRALGLTKEEPVHNLCGLLEAHGIKVFALSVASDAFFGLSIAAADGGPAVVVNTWERISVERWIFTAAHELGHLVLHREDYDVEQKAEEKAREREANLFASHFLMPDEVFWKEWNDTSGMALIDRVLKVKRMFRVSYRTVLYRLSERSKGNKSHVWKLFQNEYRRRYGRTLLKEDEPLALAADAFQASFPETARASEPDVLSSHDFTTDRLSRLVRQAVESEAITLARGAEILNLSLFEMRQLAASWLE